MPLYEYECIQNGHRFELIRKFSDPELKTCIKCKSRVKRLLSAPAISFKGSGWYVTDYARGRGSDGGSKERRDAKDAKEQKEQKDRKDQKDQKDPKPAEKAGSKGKSEGGSSSSKKS